MCSCETMFTSKFVIALINNSSPLGSYSRYLLS